MKEKVFFNGNIITMSDTSPSAEALLVQEEKIGFVGSTDEALSKASEGAEMIDLNGRTVVPGFNDNHLHATGLGDRVNQLSLAGLDAHGVVAALKERYGNEQQGAILTAYDWDYPSCPVPHKSILDEAFPNNPAILFQFGGHGLWANSYALRKMKLGPQSPDPPNGKIIRDEQGQLTGVVREVTTNSYLRKQFLSRMLNKKLIESALVNAFEEFRKAGLTSVQDNTWIFRTVTVLNTLAAAGKITARFSCWFFGQVPPLAFLMKFNRYDDQWYHRGPWKYFLDGTFTTRTAWLTEPYTDEQDNYGKGKGKSEILKILLPNVKRRRQAAFHAIGDRTISEFIDAVEELGKTYPHVKEMRYRLEHAQLIRKEDIPRLKANNICIASQPAALTTPEKDKHLLGEERAINAYPYRSLLDAGVHLSFGSDYPGEPVFKPLEIIHLAVNREGPERITPLEALRCYTVESAYVEGREEQKGSIETGKLADFAVLSEDLTAIDPGHIKDIDVLQTVVGGRIVYDNMPETGDSRKEKILVSEQRQR